MSLQLTEQFSLQDGKESQYQCHLQTPSVRATCWTHHLVRNLQMTIEMVMFSSVWGHNITQEAPKENDLQLLIHLLTKHITILHVISSTIMIQASVHSVMGQPLQPVPSYVMWYTHYVICISHQNTTVYIVTIEGEYVCLWGSAAGSKILVIKKNPNQPTKPQQTNKTLVVIIRPTACPRIPPGAALWWKWFR